jgi:hypothetical protein
MGTAGTGVQQFIAAHGLEPFAAVRGALAGNSAAGSNAHAPTRGRGKNAKSVKQESSKGASAASFDMAAVVRELKDIRDSLVRTDEEQAALTERYLEYGRRFWTLNKVLKSDEGRFEELLDEYFPGRRSTIREWMTLARSWDAADPATKIQLAGFFMAGWGPLLSELRRRKQEKRRLERNGSATVSETSGETLRILHGDCRAKLRELPDGIVDCVVTSVPYFQRLVYPGTETVFGGDENCEHDWERHQYVHRHYLNTFNEIKSGTCRHCGARLVMLGWEDTESEYVQHMVEVFNEVGRVLKKTGVLWLEIADTFQNGELLSIPSRLELGLKDFGGWQLRAEVIWHDPQRAPESATDRPYRSHSKVFMFVRQRDYLL